MKKKWFSLGVNFGALQVNQILSSFALFPNPSLTYLFNNFIE